MRKSVFMVFVLVITSALIFLSAFSFSQEMITQSIKVTSIEEVIFDELFYEHGSVMMILDANTGWIVDVNRSALKFYGYTFDEMTRMRIHDINTLSVDEIDFEMKRAVAEERNYFIFKHRLKSGEVRDVEVYSYPYKNKSGQMLLYSIIHDITEKERAKDRFKGALILLIIGTILFLAFIAIYLATVLKNRNAIRIKSNELENLFNNIEDGFISADLTGYIINVNPVALKILKCDISKLEGANIKNVYKRYDSVSQEAIGFDINTTYNNREVLLKDHEGKMVCIEETLVQVRDLNNKVTGIVIAFKDMTEHIEKQRRIEYLSYHDQLTGLFNRRYLENVVERFEENQNHPVVIMMLDVNGLKLVNDAFGHQQGDALLVGISKALQEYFDDSVVIARTGGDEFVVLFENQTVEEVELKAKAFKIAIAQRRIESIPLSASIGVFPWDLSDAFFNAARIAEDRMYEDKLKESIMFKQSVLENIEAVYIHSKETYKTHSQTVSSWACRFGQLLSVTDDVLEKLNLAARFHDVGVMVIEKQNILNAFENEEEEIKAFRKHPEIGYHILKSVCEYMEVAEWILVHHERWDGSGYPRGLLGGQINYYGRILAIAEEMATKVSRQTVVDKEQLKGILEEVFSEAGSKFDPEIIGLLRSKQELIIKDYDYGY